MNWGGLDNPGPICCCSLCGWEICAYRSRPAAEDRDNFEVPELWARQFRGLYYNKWTKTFVLTGVGIHRDPVTPYFLASPERDARWSDDDYHVNWRVELAEISAVKKSHAGIEDFVFHEACWDLLEEGLSPAPVPLSRLLTICNSQPTPTRSGAIHWGHDYGGATVVDRVNFFPWDDAVEDRTFPTPDAVFYSDPYHIPEIAHLFAEEPKEPPAAPVREPSIAIPAQGRSTDCFAGIPLELRTAIAILLPTADVLRLRLVSSAFQPVFHSQQFWASRFAAPSSDRGWLFEARRQGSIRPPVGTDWRSLYHRTNNTQLRDLSPGLRNRFRIWGLLQPLINLLNHNWVPVPVPDDENPPSVWHLNTNATSDTDANSNADANTNSNANSNVDADSNTDANTNADTKPNPDPDADTDANTDADANSATDPNSDPAAPQPPAPTAVWLGASAHMWAASDTPDGLWTAFYRGCRIIKHADIAVPADLVRFGVVPIAVGAEGEEYVAGLVLETAGGEVVRLGYHDVEGAVVGRFVDFGAGGLLGLHVAVGIRGVQALRCVVAGPAGGRVLLPWLGSSEGVPRTERLAAVEGRVVGLMATFDGYKLVSLSINVEPSPATAPELDLQATTNLRSGALWYPDVPAPSLCLNQDAFFPAHARVVAQFQYKPLIWCHFGGPGGKYLPYLTRISVTSGGGTRRIAFFFGGGDVPVECQSLGRLGGLAAAAGSERDVEFLVDGPGGERIEAVEIGHRFWEDGKGRAWEVEQGVMVWFKLRTNRGRSCLISSPEFGEATNTRTVAAVPGTAITGLYASQRPEGGYGMAGLGVITEPVGGAGGNDSEN